MVEDDLSPEKLQWSPPDDEARRIDELIREAEEAVRNTKLFLAGIQRSNTNARERVGHIQDSFEKNLKGLRRRQEQQDQR
jgi:hypothetical protein